MAGDPPLSQVVTRTFDAGVRGHRQRRRPGMPATSVPPIATTFCSCSRSRPGSATSRTSAGRAARGSSSAHGAALDVAELGAGYTLSSTRRFRARSGQRREQQRERRATAGGRPRGRASTIEPGDRMPLIPRHMLKVYADVQVTRRLASTSIWWRCRASPRAATRTAITRPDGVYYLGPGRTDAVRRRQPGRALCSDAVAHAHRPGEQPVRPPLHDRGAARPDGVHRDGYVRRPSASRRRRRVPADAQHASTHRARRFARGSGCACVSDASPYDAAAPLRPRGATPQSMAGRDARPRVRRPSSRACARCRRRTSSARSGRSGFAPGVSTTRRWRPPSIAARSCARTSCARRGTSSRPPTSAGCSR